MLFEKCSLPILNAFNLYIFIYIYWNTTASRDILFVVFAIWSTNVIPNKTYTDHIICGQLWLPLLRPYSETLSAGHHQKNLYLNQFFNPLQNILKVNTKNKLAFQKPIVRVILPKDNIHLGINLLVINQPLISLVENMVAHTLWWLAPVQVTKSCEIYFNWEASEMQPNAIVPVVD